MYVLVLVRTLVSMQSALEKEAYFFLLRKIKAKKKIFVPLELLQLFKYCEKAWNDVILPRTTLASILILVRSRRGSRNFRQGGGVQLSENF